MSTISILISILFPALVVVGVLVGGVVVTRHMIARQRDSLKLGAVNTYERLGFEPPESHDGHLLRSKGRVAELDDCFVDVRYVTMGLAMIEVMLHVPMKALGLPNDLELRVTKTSHVPPPSQGAEGYMNRVLSTGCAIEIEWGSQLLTGPIEEFFNVAIPDAYAKLAELDAYYTEPLTSMLIEGGWLVLKRSVTQQSISARKAKGGEPLERYLAQLIQQTGEFARAFSWEWERPEELCERIFMESSPFTPHREHLLSMLFQKHRGTPASERAWRYALDRGNLHDVVFAINSNQHRALEELSDERFITFVNTLIDSDSFDVSSLPNLAAQRFDFSALMNTRMSWAMRKALLMLWLGTIDPDNAEFNEHVSRLPTTLRPSERLELLGVFMRQPSTVSQSLAPIYASWVRSKQPIEPSEYKSLLAAYVALERTLEEHELDALARDSEIELVLIAILEHNLPPAAIAARLLGSFGTAAALPVIKKAIDRAGQTLMGQGAEAKAARESIVERVRRDPTSGGLSVSHEPDLKGGISSAQGEAGGLAIISDEQGDP